MGNHAGRLFGSCNQRIKVRETLGVPGTGLGMLISRSLIEQMGGGLQVFSEPRKGTTVVLELGVA